MTFQSSDALQSRPVIVIHGLPLVGKTFLSLALSKDWGTQPGLPKPGTILRDIAHVGWDRNALAGIRQHGIKLAASMDMEFLLSKAGKPHMANPVEAMNYVVNETAKLVDKNPNIKILIEDTGTRRNALLERFCMKRANPANAGMRKQVYGEILSYEEAYYQGLCATGIPVLCFLMHTRNISEDGSETPGQKIRNLMVQLGNSTVKLRPALIGSAIDTYTRETSLEVYVRKVPGLAGKPDQRFIHPTLDSKEQNRTKNRYDKWLPGKVTVQEFVATLRKNGII